MVIVVVVIVSVVAVEVIAVILILIKPFNSQGEGRKRKDVNKMLER